MADADPYSVLDEEAPVSSRETEEQREAKDFVWLAGIRRGRRIVWRLLEKTGCFRLSYSQGDPVHTAFNEGQRNFGQQLMALILRDSPEQFVQMLKEHEEDVRRNADDPGRH